VTGLPLEGVKVVDVSEHGFVPSAAATLADWGADVVKVEKPAGDALRSIMKNGLVNDAGAFDFCVEIANRNKRGISIDLKQAEGRALLDRVIVWADVFITNQLPKVLRKLRLEAADVFAVNPGIVYARGHGQGQLGPEAEDGGFDGVSYWARAGIAHMLTPEGAEAVVGSRPALGDHPSGAQLAGAIAAALVKSLRTGVGVKVDLSLLASGIWALGPDLAFTSYMGNEPPRTQNDRRSSSPLVGGYRTSDRRQLQLVMLNDDVYWPRVCRSIGLDELIDDARYDTLEKRIANNAELRERFQAVFGSKPLVHWKERLRAEACIFSNAASPVEVLQDPQVSSNGYLPEHPVIAGARLPATPAQFDDQPIEIRRAAPSIGEHTDEVLAEIGLTASEIEELRSRGAVR